MVDHAIKIMLSAFGAWLIALYMNLSWPMAIFTFVVLFALTLIFSEMRGKWWWT